VLGKGVTLGDGDEYSGLRCVQMAADKLDGTDKLITLPHPMHFVIRTLLVFVAAAFVFAESVPAGIVFKPGKKPEYVAPGEEEINGNAAELFQIAQAAEKEGNIKRAIKANRSLVKRYPKDALERCIAQLSCRNKRASISGRRNHFAIWWKNIPPARTSKRQSRRSFGSGKCIWEVKR